MLVCLIKNFRFAHCKFKAFPAHILDEDGQMKLTPARNLEAFGGIRFLYPKGNIRIQLTEQSVPKMAAGHEFAFLSGKRRIIYDKMHGDRRLGNLLKRNGLRIFRRA